MCNISHSHHPKLHVKALQEASGSYHCQSGTCKQALPKWHPKLEQCQQEVLLKCIAKVASTQPQRGNECTHLSFFGEQRESNQIYVVCLFDVCFTFSHSEVWAWAAGCEPPCSRSATCLRHPQPLSRAAQHYLDCIPHPSRFCCTSPPLSNSMPPA